MKYFAIMFAALMLTAPSYAQRPDRTHRGSQARVEAHKGSDLKQEVKALRKELEALKKQVAGMRQRLAKKAEGTKAEGRRGRKRGSRGVSGVRGKRGHKKDDKVTPERPDWNQIRQRMERFRKGEGSLKLNEGWQRGWAAKK